MNELIWLLSPGGYIFIWSNFYSFIYQEDVFSIHYLINEYNSNIFRVDLRMVSSSIIYILLGMNLLAYKPEKKTGLLLQLESHHNITSSLLSQFYGVRITYCYWIYWIECVFLCCYSTTLDSFIGLNCDFDFIEIAKDSRKLCEGYLIIHNLSSNISCLSWQKNTCLLLWYFFSKFYHSRNTI